MLQAGASAGLERRAGAQGWAGRGLAWGSCFTSESTAWSLLLLMAPPAEPIEPGSYWSRGNVVDANTCNHFSGCYQHACVCLCVCCHLAALPRESCYSPLACCHCASARLCKHRPGARSSPGLAALTASLMFWFSYFVAVSCVCVISSW